MGFPLVIAHRGASADAPENTLPAFERAIALGADMVELDVRRTYDGALVVHHDPQIDRQPIATLRHAELLAIAPQVPTLAEVIDCCADRIRLDVELKEAGYEAEVLQTLTVLPVEAWVATSFLPEVIQRVKQLHSAASSGLLIDAKNQAIAHAFLAELEPDSTLMPNFLAPHWSLIDTVALKTLPHTLPAIAWTVNQPEVMQRLLTHSGIIGIITDRPDVLLAQISKLKQP